MKMDCLRGSIGPMGKGWEGYLVRGCDFARSWDSWACRRPYPNLLRPSHLKRCNEFFPKRFGVSVSGEPVS